MKCIVLVFPVVVYNALVNYDDLRRGNTDNICIVDDNRLLMVSKFATNNIEQIRNGNVLNIARDGFAFVMLDINTLLTRNLLTHGRDSWFYGTDKLILSIIPTGEVTFKVLFVLNGTGLVYEQIRVFNDEDNLVLPYVSITDRVEPAFINKRYENIVINKDVRNDVFKCHTIRGMNEVNEFLRGCV